MAIKFKSATRHGKLTFAPGISTAFEDADAEPYFKAAFDAEDTDEEPVMSYSQDEVDIDPSTVFADGPRRGQLVMEAE